ncbi:hypothetical protein BV25DRAFT_1235518 [Artomyces pyxidatus]|uniref:Uncharacterized protein n=1 Tax=Artomyces pyxidatus TaxID=48021 RepID=A0ACB8SR40_9AGAM|nr:hypothetical protein BV25DRAFT_1235518 [Artomyces pyxidatus]
MYRLRPVLVVACFSALYMLFAPSSMATSTPDANQKQRADQIIEPDNTRFRLSQLECHRDHLRSRKSIFQSVRNTHRYSRSLSSLKAYHETPLNPFPVHNLSNSQSTLRVEDYRLRNSR